MPMYNSTEYRDVYSKTLSSLWQYYRDKLALDNNIKIIDFHANIRNDSILFKFKQPITGQTGKGCTKNVEVMVSSKYSKF